MNSIRAKLVTTFISLAIIPLMILGGVLIWENSVVEIDRIKVSQQRKTALASENIAIFLHEQENKILSLLRMHYFPEMPVEEQKKELSKFLSISKDKEHGYIFDNIILLDLKGRELFRASRTNLVKDDTAADWTDSELLTESLATETVFYSSIFFSEDTGEPMLDMSVPIINLHNHKPQEILIAEMKLKFLWLLVSNLKIGTEGIAYLTDENGRVVVHPNRSIVLKNTRLKIPPISKIMPGLTGEQAVVAAQKIDFGNLPLYFVTEVPKSEAFRQIYTSLFILGTILLLTLICGVAIIFIFVRQIVQPLESIATTARDISSGNYSKTAEPYKIKELLELSTAFNSMTERLHETITNLETQINFVENVIESLTHPLYVVDAKDYTVKMANSASNFGMLTSDSKCHKLTHKSDVPCSGLKHPCVVDEIKKTGRPTMMQHVHRDHVDNSERIFEVYGYPIFDSSGKITQVIEYNVDISEKKGLEDQLRQAQKLEAIGSLASGVAHDFNNLLTTIIGYSELCMLKLAKDDPLRERVEAIYEAGMKASTLTRQLLAFSRKQVLEMQVLNLDDLLENLTKMLKRMIGEKIEIRMNLDPSSGNIKADPGQIEQVIMNLAINARDAMPDGGAITIETQMVVLDDEYCKTHAAVEPGTYVALYVTDEGIGIPTEVMEKIFDPFFTTKDKGAGTGLGLSTVYGIVKQHNGHIYVYSEMGNGTTFKIYFPTIEKAVNSKGLKISPPMEKGVETILVVDDEVSIRKLIYDTLTPLGYKILEAANGKEALEIFRQNDLTVDLLLTDVIMPKMTGKQLGEIVRKENPGARILYMSGYTDNVIAHQGILDEGVDFINKPLIPSLLTKKIRKVLKS